MPGQILTCEVCGREGRAIPCKNFKHCQQGRCPICFVTILDTPEAWSQVWSIQLTCESCCQYGSRCLVDDKDLPSLSSQAVGKALQQQSSSKLAAEKRQRPSADGQVQPSKRPKGSSAPVKSDVKPTPAQLSVKHEASPPPPAAAAAHKKAATPAEKRGTSGPEVQKPAVKQTSPAESQHLGSAKKAATVAAAAGAAKDAGKQQPVYSKRPPEATAEIEEQPPLKRQASEQQINKHALGKGGSKAGSSGGAAASDKGGSKTGCSSGAAAAAAALQAKVGASSGLQRPLSGGGLLSKSRTTGTVGTCSRQALPTAQEHVAASGGVVGAGLRHASSNQQRPHRTPGSGGQFVAAAKLGQSRPGGSSVGPNNTEELGKVDLKQQVGGVVKQPLQPLPPTPSNNQDQQRQHNAVKQQELTPRSRVEAFPTVSPSPQQQPSLSLAKAATGIVAQPATAQPKAPEQQPADVQDKNRQQLEKLRKKKQQQLEKEEQQLAKQQHERQQPALAAKQKAQQPPHTTTYKKPDGLVVASNVARPTSGKQDRATTTMGAATARSASGKATSRLAGNDAGAHAASAAKLSSGVDASAAGCPLQPRGNPSANAMLGGKLQDKLNDGCRAGFKQPDESMQQRAVEGHHAGSQLEQGPPTRPTLAERQQQRRQTALAVHRVGFSLSQTVQNIGGVRGSTERGASEERADEGTMRADAQAPAVAMDAPKRRSTPIISCDLRVASESMFWAVQDAKVHVLLGQLPPLLAQHQGSAKYSGSIAGRNVLDSFEGDEVGDMLAAPDFSRVTVILRERAFGGKKMLPSLIDTLVRGSKYVKIEHGGQKMYLAPVLKQREDDKELVDYVTFTLGKHEDVWSRVYDDRLGVFSYHKPGEPPATRLADVEDVASALAPTPRLWDPQAPPERPALRQSSLGGVGGGCASVGYVEPLPALAHPSPAQALDSFMGDDDDLFGYHDHDEHAGAANASFGVGMAHQSPAIASFGVGVGSGGLGVGMGSGVLGPNVAVGFVGGTGEPQTYAGADFMEQDAYEDALEFELAPHSNSMPTQLVTEYSPSMGLLQQQSQSQPTARPGYDTTDVGASAQGTEEEKTRTVHFADANGVATSAGATQQQPSHMGHVSSAHGSLRALEPQPSLEKQTNVSGNVVTQVVQSQTACKLLLPSLSGLCKHINDHGIKGLRVHLDTSLTQHARDKARKLTAFLREQGAIVTETIPAPPPCKVQVLLVGKQWVLTQGLEGRSAHFRLIEYLVAGTHVMTESFVEALKAGKLVVEDLEKERSHAQVFAEGVHLLWDATLLRGSTSADLAELVRSVEEASARLGGGQQNKQRFKAWVVSKDRGNAPEHFRLLNSWLDTKIVDTLPKAYISSSKEMVKTAAKAIHIMNKDVFPLRYMMVVVPDPDSSTAQQKLTEDDWRYIGTLVLAANNQKTICAATRTQAIQFLNLVR